ncbi:MAG: hypothetical protein ACFCUO_09610 [Rhodospirillales bacterium]
MQSIAPMKVCFEDLSPADRAAAAGAASRFLLENDYASLDDACQDLAVDPQDLWDRIMDVAGLAPCFVPAFVMVH